MQYKSIERNSKRRYTELIQEEISNGPIGASIVAISPRTVLDLNPALAMSKPNFESKGPPITARDVKTMDNSGKSYL